MMASSRGRNRSSPRDGRGFGRIGCLLDQAEEHAIMNRAETEDGSYVSARNRKLLAGLGLKPGENEYAEPALNPCQTTAYAFFTGDQIASAAFCVGAIGRRPDGVVENQRGPAKRAPKGKVASRINPRFRVLSESVIKRLVLA